MTSFSGKITIIDAMNIGVIYLLKWERIRE